jgi:flagellar protein FlbT
MPLKIAMKDGEKIIVNGAVLQARGAPAQLLVLNSAAIMREKDIVTADEAQTPASRAYFALQNLYLFPGRQTEYEPLARSFLTDYANAAPSARELVDLILAALDGSQYYVALRQTRELLAHEGQLLSRLKESLAEEEMAPATA